MKYEWKDFGFNIPQIMIPREGTDYAKWAVVACDQFTSQPEYWKETEAIVGDAPSTLNLMLPELYLGSDEEPAKIETIRKTMKAYLEDGTLQTLEPGCMLVRREAEGRSRLGLVISVDLESYDYNKGSQSLIRATEGTVVERIPPRLRIRRGAPLEMPHIMILIDDPDHTVIEPLEDLDLETIYDTDLMQGGGHVTGKFVPEKKLDGMKEALGKLMDQAIERYGEGHVIFQAMGDGNHSLATAKAAWEEIKKDLSVDDIETHPARYALCEIENVFDPGIVFEPIHRVVFAAPELKGKDLMDKLCEVLAEQNGGCAFVPDGADEADTVPAGDGFAVKALYEGAEGKLVIDGPCTSKLAVGTLQNAIDVLVKEDGASVDYIHGEAAVRELASKDGNLGFLLPAMDKFQLFPAVAADGALPRKTFSMGEANEKRYYIEVRSLA